MDMERANALFRLLGDEGRLRILRLLGRERLNVSELTAILGLAQSGVSRHLRLLKEAGLVVEDRAAGWAYYRVPADRFTGPARLTWKLLHAHLASNGSHYQDDDARLQEVLRHRQENFDPDLTPRLQLVPGRSWAAWARAIGHLIPPLRVADLGCGEGYLAVETARWAKAVIAIDRSTTMLKRASEMARRLGVTTITWKRGDIERLPLAAASVDVALLAQALHCARRPARALAEAARILTPGGRLLVLDLKTHREEWVRARLGHRWLGFEEAELRALLAAQGFAAVRIQIGARRRGDPFTVLIASGVKARHQKERS